MALKRTVKKRLITKSKTHDKDTGSPQVQIAILTKEIDLLTKHLQEHRQDHSARRGLLGKVARRRTLLNYLRMNKPEQYQEVLVMRYIDGLTPSDIAEVLREAPNTISVRLHRALKELRRHMDLPHSEILDGIKSPLPKDPL